MNLNFTYCFHDALHLGEPVILQILQSTSFQKGLLNSLSSNSNLRERQCDQRSMVITEMEVVSVVHFIRAYCYLTHLKNISSSSSKIGTSFDHNGCGQNGGTIVDDENTTSSTSHHGTFKNREFHVKVGDILKFIQDLLSGEWDKLKQRYFTVDKAVWQSFVFL